MTDQPIPAWLREEAAQWLEDLPEPMSEKETVDAIAAFALHVSERLAQEARDGRVRCQCAIPDPVMQADRRFYCYTCSLQVPAVLCDRCSTGIVAVAAKGEDFR